MLFDLQARGRRNAIKAIYLSLALLMGGGLVLFGIGSDAGQGGLIDGVFGNDAQSADNPFQDRLDAAERQVKANPQNAAAFATLARLRFQNAGVEGFDQTTGQFSDEGRAQLVQADQAWQRHLKLAGDKPNREVAQTMVQAYQSLGDAGKTVAAMEIYLDGVEDPNARQYTQYATYAYAAGQTRKADLAAKRATSLAKPDEREQIKALLESAKSGGTAGASGATSAEEAPSPLG